MSYFARVWLGVFCLAQLAVRAEAAFIADSIAEFSLTQGQDGWTYGFYDQLANGLPYQPDRFTLFDVANGAENSWKASNSLVPSVIPGQLENNFFLNINADGGHPTGTGILEQNRILWAMRRYTSEVSGFVSIHFDVHKINTGNVNGGGITGHIFVDGVELLNQFIANADGVGVQGVRTVFVNMGSRIDLAIDSFGVATMRDSDPYSPRADGSHFSAVISTGAVPEPSSALLLGMTAILLCWYPFTRRSRC